MKSTWLTSTLPLLRNHDNSNNTINTLWEGKDWCKNVFGTNSPPKGNIVRFFFQLIATKIISFALVNKSNLKCIITVQSNGKYRYEDASIWAGIEIRSPKKGGAEMYLTDIITAQQKHYHFKPLSCFLFYCFNSCNRLPIWYFKLRSERLPLQLLWQLQSEWLPPLLLS